MEVAILATLGASAHFGGMVGSARRAKMMRLREHVEWAQAEGVLDDVTAI